MDLDITDILRDWPYEPGQMSVRKIRGLDGREKIQVRLDLGVLQMETTGRPDGLRPHGCDSLLEYQQRQRERHIAEVGSDEGFRLDTEACDQLRAEAVMYYHRYLAEFVLEDFPAVVRDTARNLGATDFLVSYAKDESDRFGFEQYRPYLIMMNTRARGQIALGDRQPQAALEAVREGIHSITQFYNRIGQEKLATSSGELAVLRSFAKEIQKQIPTDPLRQLKSQLRQAVQQERYEEAARLRDEICRCGGAPEAGGDTEAVGIDDDSEAD